jgi:uracil phosphoribosyltransferase
MKNLTIVSHPLINHSLTILRDRKTKTDEFMRHADAVSLVILIEALKGLKVQKKHIDTPLAPFEGKELQDDIVVIPILRAGLAMLSAFRRLVPSAPVGFIGLERDEQTAVAREYYKKIPAMVHGKTAIIVDPMLATGGSLDDTISAVKKLGAKKIIAACVISAPEGIKRIEEHHRDVHVVTGCVDIHLNEKSYIVPGLGDFGDRYFGT